jgi:hypothetical protein
MDGLCLSISQRQSLHGRSDECGLGSDTDCELVSFCKFGNKSFSTYSLMAESDSKTSQYQLLQATTTVSFTNSNDLRVAEAYFIQHDSWVKFLTSPAFCICEVTTSPREVFLRSTRLTETRRDASRELNNRLSSSEGEH